MSDQTTEGRPARTRVVILGGGTAGWMAAAALQGHLGRLVELTLIESQDIGIVGVGEATLPHIRDFIQGLGIDEAEFMAATQATFKLGIKFVGFGAAGESYIHPFGTFGKDIAGVGFHHYWLRAGRGAIGDYSLAVAAAHADRFSIPGSNGSTLASTYGYAYQFDATRFGPFLRDWTTGKGATRIEGRVVDVERNPLDGSVSALVLENGDRVEGELFIDCSGFRSLLLGGVYDEAWEDWSRWLPCDRAVAVPCGYATDTIEPLTTAIAMPAGWRWRIPLQSRVGNGYVYSSAHLGDDEAQAALMAQLDQPAQAEPRLLRFRAGRRRRSWVGNVVALGLSSGFLEPLESTSIYLAQVAIARLIELFPVDGIREADRVEFNRAIDLEYDRVRDFLILHYNATRRTDSPFWNDVRTMDVPPSLSDKVKYWKATARVAHYEEGLFLEPSWVAVYLGQGVIPDHYDARADIPDGTALACALDNLRDEIGREVAAMPSHRALLARQSVRAAGNR